MGPNGSHWIPWISLDPIGSHWITGSAFSPLVIVYKTKSPHNHDELTLSKQCFERSKTQNTRTAQAAFKTECNNEGAETKQYNNKKEAIVKLFTSTERT